jgi:hypothetical protein
MGSVICNSCCGARRGSRIDCPPGCVHFPFGGANYDMLLKIESSWNMKATKYVIAAVGDGEFIRKAESLAPAMSDGESEFASGAELALMDYLAMGDSEEHASLASKWSDRGWPGLNNDERYMAQYRCRSLPGIIEVQKILGDKSMECIDLLDGERGRFVVFDRSLAGSAARFDKVVVWMTHYPYLTRTTGAGWILPDEHADSFLREIRDLAEESLGSGSDEAVKQYLARHFNEARQLIADISDAWRERMIASMDADLCRAYYGLLAPRGKIEAVIREKPDFEIEDDFDPGQEFPPETALYTWLRRGEARDAEKEIDGLIRYDDDEEAVGVLGSLYLSDTRLAVETRRRALHEFAGKLTLSYFGDMIVLEDEEIIPLKELMDKYPGPHDEPEGPSSKVPPEVEKIAVENMYKKLYSDFIDVPVPMLDDMTPREASKIPAMRPKLVELIKGHLHGIDKMRIQKGVEYDLGWVLDELGLDELK